MSNWTSAAGLISFGAAASLLMTSNPFSFVTYPIGFWQSSVKPMSESERVETEFLKCLEESAVNLRDGSIVDVKVSDKVFDGGSVSYLSQRLDEILYPRLRITGESAGWLMQIKHESEVPIGPFSSDNSSSAETNQVKCSNVLIEFREMN